LNRSNVVAYKGASEAKVHREVSILSTTNIAEKTNQIKENIIELNP